jgi:L-ribulokinase
LAFQDEFQKNLNARPGCGKIYAFAEAQEITAGRPPASEYLAKCGGVYSSEWFFSKISTGRVAPKIFEAAWSWVGSPILFRL